jgi:hypothetical protein
MLSAGLAVLGGWLVVCGLVSAPGAFFVAHLKVSGIMLLLGFISLLVSGVMFAVPIVLVGRRREAQSLAALRQRKRGD